MHANVHICTACLRAGLHRTLNPSCVVSDFVYKCAVNATMASQTFLAGPIGEIELIKICWRSISNQPINQHRNEVRPHRFCSCCVHFIGCRTQLMLRGLSICGLRYNSFLLCIYCCKCYLNKFCSVWGLSYWRRHSRCLYHCATITFRVLEHSKIYDWK